MSIRRWFPVPGVMVVALLIAGCGEDTSLLDPTLFLSPSFVNYAVGGVVPLAPGESSGFILVRAVNRTTNAIEFVVTVEREVFAIQTFEPDADDTGPTTELYTYHLQTFPGGLTNEVGILIDCPVIRVGLGEDLNSPADGQGLIVGTGDEGLVVGSGVPGNVNPLDSRAGNFSCGDTLVFDAIEVLGVVGNVKVNTFVLSAEGQPATFSGPDTFNSARSLVDQYTAEE